MHRPWSNSVLLALDNKDEFVLISSTADAYAFLATQWPIDHGTAFVRALQVCKLVADGECLPDIAHDAFVLAANEVGLPVNDFRGAEVGANIH